MGQMDVAYQQLVLDIIEQGEWDKDQQVRTVWADGTSAYTKSLVSRQFAFDNSEVPILTTKRVPWKSAIHELLWFYVQRTSDCSYLDHHQVKIWREWANEHNNIGTAYGYQLGKPIMLKGKITNQVEHLIEQLKTNPASRRHIISLWNIDDLDQMELYPCVWNNQWLVKQGRLHLIVNARSNDIGLGNPFNVFQYYVLQRMVSQVTQIKMGTLIYNMNDAHIYERHIDPLLEQMKREPYQAPQLWVNPEVKHFDDFTIDDFQLVDYQYHPSVKMEIAI